MNFTIVIHVQGLISWISKVFISRGWYISFPQTLLGYLIITTPSASPLITVLAFSCLLTTVIFRFMSVRCLWLSICSDRSRMPLNHRCCALWLGMLYKVHSNKALSVCCAVLLVEEYPRPTGASPLFQTNTNKTYLYEIEVSRCRAYQFARCCLYLHELASGVI